MNVDVTALPGVGVRKDFSLSKVDRRLGVIDRRDGGTDLIFTAVDTDACEQVPLSDAEARALAGLLGAPQLVAKLRAEHREIDGVTTRSILIGHRGPFAGRPLGDTQLRTRTRASVVAVLREGRVLPSPGPEFVFAAMDTVVVVGTLAGLDVAVSILTGG